MTIFYVCRKCKKYYGEDEYMRLKLIRYEPKIRICEVCGDEMTHQKCFVYESYR